MRLHMPRPFFYWGFCPFDEITIESQEGILEIFLHALVRENTFFGIVTKVLLDIFSGFR